MNDNDVLSYGLFLQLAERHGLDTTDSHISALFPEVVAMFRRIANLKDAIKAEELHPNAATDEFCLDDGSV